MRRISARHARPGMVLGRPVLDSYGNTVLPAGTALGQESLMTLAVHGVREVLVEDQRLEDVAVQPLVLPEVEAQAVRALRDLLTECRGAPALDEGLLYEAEGPVYSMVRELFPAVVGEASASGCSSREEYEFLQPVKVAGLSLLLGRRMGMGMAELAAMGTAALLKDVGFLRLPRGLADSPEPMGPEPSPEAGRHPELGAAMLRGCTRLSPHVAMAVLQHHERWDGSGYPSGLKGSQTSPMARVIAVADAYYALVSERPHRPPAMPHEAVEIIMACGGDLLDPAVVHLFARNVPLYPTGVTVRLGSGETGVVSDGNAGHVGRPVVRVCYDASGRPLAKPFDLDLSRPEHQSRMITQVLDY